MKRAIPIALIVMGGLVILVPVVSRSYENTEIRRMLIELNKAPAQERLAQSDAFRLTRDGQYDPLYFVLGGWMIAGGALWPALANVLGRFVGPRRIQTLNAGDEVQQAPGDVRLKS
jgi:hypothetical protein